MDRLINGDCIEELDKIEDKSVDLLFTDPPFGINFTGKENFYYWRDPKDVVGYEEVIDNYLEFSRAWIPKAISKLKDSGSGYIVSGWSNVDRILSVLRDLKIELTNHVIWRFPFGVYAKTKFVTSHYHVLYFRMSDDYLWNAPAYTEDVIENPRSRRSGPKNANSLPIKLVKKFIGFSSKKGDVVLDPFLGSGTTYKACLAMGRDCIGIEINDETFKIATKTIKGGMFT